MRGIQAGRLRGVRAEGPPPSAAEQPTTLSLVTVVPHVQLLETGDDWVCSTGVFTFDQADLASAVAAQDDPSMPAPIIKLGHTDPRFTDDGQPAVGRVINMALENDGQLLVGDLAGLPTWLATYMSTLYPRRSVEGNWGAETRTGTVWPFAITALALLGTAYPAIGTLADIERLLGPAVPALVDADGEPAAVAASAATLSPVRVRPHGPAVAVRRNYGLARA